MIGLVLGNCSPSWVHVSGPVLVDTFDLSNVVIGLGTKRRWPMWSWSIVQMWMKWDEWTEHLEIYVPAVGISCWALRPFGFTTCDVVPT